MVNEVSRYAKFCECPNCKTIGKTRYIKEKATGSVSLSVFLLGIFFTFLFFLFVSKVIFEHGSAEANIISSISGCAFYYLWITYFTAVRKETAINPVCPRCGYNHIILLMENEYQQRKQESEKTGEN